MSCLLGDCSYRWDIDTVPELTILAHILTDHNVVIATIETVYNLPEYLKYWRKKINTGTLNQYLKLITAVMEKKEGPDQYYLLNDTSNEDRNLRYKLYQDTLDKVLAVHLCERSNIFDMICLFCPDNIKGDKASVCQHFSQLHSFTLGKPDNIVYFSKFIELLRSKMIDGKCFYCDKTFRDYKTLREHMRKKFHKKINADNKEYDKFYLVNYREFGISWKYMGDEIDERTQEDDDWTEWMEDSPSIQCLMCSSTFPNLSDTTQHMTTQHLLYFDKMITGINYYNQVKLVNYVRYTVEKGNCPFCGEKVLDFSSHCCGEGLDFKLLDDERYLFPALDNDFLLCCLTPDEDEEAELPTTPAS